MQSDSSDDGGWTTLMSAASRGDLVTVKRIVIEGSADPNARNEAGCTALHYACSKGHDQVVRALLQMDRINLNVQEFSSKSTPIIRAMITNRVGIVKQLIDAGAKLNLKDHEGNTVLHYAISSENVELVVQLIKAGALDDIKNSSGQSPMSLASVFMRSSLEEELDDI